MTTIQEKIDQERQKMIPARLVKGAKVLGEIFREGKKCESGGWSQVCSCGPKATEFCTAKLRWVSLFADYDPGLVAEVFDDPFFISLCMNEEMLVASGLTFKVQGPPGLPPISIGKKGTFFQTLIDIINAAPAGSVDQGAAWMTVVQVQEALK